MDIDVGWRQHIPVYTVQEQEVEELYSHGLLLSSYSAAQPYGDDYQGITSTWEDQLVEVGVEECQVKYHWIGHPQEERPTNP
ncbi:hypothetical protein PR048_025786 [Dryococelus australis]|uniref:MHC class I antigen n=1 Tax=Dryococelus australis TaxID=614101 RepID=A0ABQ9GJK5_9NEOP|nr:hypothetical protein PR048_025786 [Dryococelus australis]